MELLMYLLLLAILYISLIYIGSYNWI